MSEDDVKQIVLAFRVSLTEAMDGLHQRVDELARAMQDFSREMRSRTSELEQRMLTMETGILNEIRLQSHRTSRIEERPARLEGAA